MTPLPFNPPETSTQDSRSEPMSTAPEDTAYGSGPLEDEVGPELGIDRWFDLRFANKGSSQEWCVTSDMVQIIKKSGNADAHSAGLAAFLKKMGMLPKNPNKRSLDEAINADSDFRPDTLASAYQPMEAALRQEGERIGQWRLQLQANQEGWNEAVTSSGIAGLASYAQFTARGAAVRVGLAKDLLLDSDKPYSGAVKSALTFVERRSESAAGATDEDNLARVRLLSLTILRHQRVATHLTALSSALRSAIAVGEEAIACHSLSLATIDEALVKDNVSDLSLWQAQLHAVWEQSAEAWDDDVAEAEGSARAFLQYRSDVLDTLTPEFHKTHKQEVASMITTSSAQELVRELALYQVLNDDAGDRPHTAVQTSSQKLSKSARRAARQKAKAASSAAISKSSEPGGSFGASGAKGDLLWSSASAALRRSIQSQDSTAIESPAPPSGPWERVSSVRTLTRGTGPVRPPESLFRRDDESQSSGVPRPGYSSYGKTFNEMFWKPLIIGGDRWWRQTNPDPEFEPAPLLAGPTPAPPMLTSGEEEVLTGDQRETRARLRKEQLQLQGTPEQWERARGWVTSAEHEHTESPLTERGGPSTENKATTGLSSLDDEMETLQLSEDGA